MTDPSGVLAPQGGYVPDMAHPPNAAIADPVPGSERPDVSITACPNGPLLVRGDFVLVGPDGREIPKRRKTVALCRCGLSSIKPNCDGSHKAAGFQA